MAALTQRRRKEILPHLPQEIITEIIHRLPFRSVLRSKRVSKQWKELINDPKFYKPYKDNSRTAFFRDSVLYCLFIDDDDKERIHGEEEEYNIPSFTVHRVANTPLQLHTYHCIGLSSGLACFRKISDRSFHFYNLFTGSWDTAAKSPLDEDSDYLELYHYGFGFDHYGDDYKIFACGFRSKVVWIYSFRNKDWNPFRGFPYENYPSHMVADPDACSINGVLHWYLECTEDPTSSVIVSYDLHTNRFGEIQAPHTSATEDDGMVDNLSPTVAELNGQLCVVHEMIHNKFRQFKKTIVWVMKEYRVGDSWERFASIDCDSKIMTRMAPTALLYKCINGSRVVLFLCIDKERLIWYNIDKNKIEFVEETIWRRS